MQTILLKMKNIITQSVLIAFCCVFSTLFVSNSLTAQDRLEKCMTQVFHSSEMQSNPDYAKSYQKRMAKLAQNLSEASSQKVDDSDCSAGLQFIPIAVHYADFTGTPAEQECLIELAEQQIDVLNNAFQGLICDSPNSWDSASGGCFEFCIASKNHPVAAGIVDGEPAVTFGEGGFCPLSGGIINPCNIATWGGYMNIVVRQTPGSGVLGISWLSGNPNTLNAMSVQSCAWGTTNVACSAAINNYMGSGSCAGFSSAQSGQTLTHEVGHFLGLSHVFCSDAGCSPCNVNSTGTVADCDGVTDTPAQQFSQFGCPGGSANGSAANPTTGTQYTYNNFMDYVNDDCMNCFSAGQKARMQATFAGNGGYETKANVCSPVVLPPDAVCSQLTALSVGEPVCSADGYTYSITVNWEGSDIAVAIDGGDGAFPEATNAGELDGTVTFTYSSITAAGGYIAVTADQCEDFSNFFFTNPACEYAPIPTMGEWGIMALALILIIFGVVAVRQTTTRTIKA